MAKNKLKETVLVLNRGWMPVHIKTVEDALSTVVKGLAYVLDHRDNSYGLYDFQDWCDLGVEDGCPSISTTRVKFALPEIIVLKSYSDAKYRENKWSRRNVFLRDLYECQYCRKQITQSTGSIDHVQPRSRGGGNTWDNTVAACLPCNQRKKNQTPKEAGMTLLSQPTKPKWYSLGSKITSGYKTSWDFFLPDKSRIPEFLTRKVAEA